MFSRKYFLFVNRNYVKDCQNKHKDDTELSKNNKEVVIYLSKCWWWCLWQLCLYDDEKGFCSAGHRSRDPSLHKAQGPTLYQALEQFWATFPWPGRWSSGNAGKRTKLMRWVRSSRRFAPHYSLRTQLHLRWRISSGLNKSLKSLSFERKLLQKKLFHWLSADISFRCFLLLKN